MKNSLYDQLGTDYLRTLGTAVGIEMANDSFYATLREIPPLPEGFTIGDAARAYLMARLASVGPAPAVHPDGAAVKVALIMQWLTYQNDDLSMGLRSAADAERLYDFWKYYEDTLPEYADVDDVIELAPYRIAALGYDPLAAT